MRERERESQRAREPERQRARERERERERESERARERERDRERESALHPVVRQFRYAAELEDSRHNEPDGGGEQIFFSVGRVGR